jgi:hypothetical protein
MVWLVATLSSVDQRSPIGVVHKDGSEQVVVVAVGVVLKKKKEARSADFFFVPKNKKIADAKTSFPLFFRLENR